MDQRQLDFEYIATNLRVEQALCDVLPLLDGLAVVVFKGTCLTKLLYGDLRKRASSDNDLWVPHGRCPEALDRLLAAGYRALPHIDPHRALDRYGQVALLREGDPNLVSVDLHAFPFSRRFFEVSESHLLPHTQSMLIGGLTVTTFDRTATFSHLIAHWVQHIFESDHLGDIAHAWNRWSGEFSQGDREQIEHWVSSGALQLALHQAQKAGYPIEGIPALVEPRARLIHKLDLLSAHPLVRRTAALALVAPHKVLQNAALFVFPSSEELHSRYGDAALWRLRLLHLKYLLQS